jgi:hypothetical protein
MAAVLRSPETMIDRRCSESLGSSSLTRQAAHLAIWNRSAPLGCESLDDAVRAHGLPADQLGYAHPAKGECISTAITVQSNAHVTSPPLPRWPHALSRSGQRTTKDVAFAIVTVHSMSS